MYILLSAIKALNLIFFSLSVMSQTNRINLIGFHFEEGQDSRSQMGMVVPGSLMQQKFGRLKICRRLKFFGGALNLSIRDPQ